MKVDAAVIFAKTVIVYYPTYSNKSVYQETFLVFALNIMNDVDMLEVKGVTVNE
jgi:hypothetical protein